MLNRIVLIGRLTKDPELRYTTSGTAVCNFTLAVDRSRKNQQGEKETDFLNVVAWGKLGELCANHLTKGKLAAAEGELHIDRWEIEGGEKRQAPKINADNVRFLSPKDSQGQGSHALGNEVSFSDDDFPF